MCGIAGICFADGRPIAPEVLRRMGESIAHRGPDGDGIHIDERGAPSIGMASRRLAIIDIEGGAQPMSTEDGRFTIVYNGELFNADEVRGELRSAGQSFRTRCDTEVVLRGYAHWGEAVLDRLNGMWAFAIWDAAERRLFLARDRLGVKPLVYAETKDALVFGSEIKSLIASGLVARELDPAPLPHYLSFFAIPEPYSLVRGVARLEAGHALSVDARGVRKWCYWDCAVPEEDDRGRDAYREEIEALLDDSVQRRLVSDVPLGVLLSGGIDSNLVATMAADRLDQPLRTFTLGFDHPDLDEREPARASAQSLGATHTEDAIGVREALASLPDVLAAYDEPGQSLLQTHFVCELAARDVTVALSGLGGDELFSAYPAHVVASLLARLDRVPRPLRKSAVAAAKVVGGRLARAARLAAMDADERAARRLMHQTDAELRSNLLATSVRGELDLDAPARHLEAHFARARSHDPLNRMLYVYIKTYLTDELLRASDAMSMLHSLELRTPFLDYRLVERAMAIPARHKMHGGTGKLILRDIATDRLPPALLAGKRGFTPPVGAWMKGELQERVRDVLSTHAVRERGLFDPVAVERLVSTCINGDDRLVQPVMMLYCFEVWARHWLDGEPAAAAEQTPIALHDPARPLAERDLSVIIVNWNTRERLRECLSSVEQHLASVDYEVIVVDNASTDGSQEMVEEHFPTVRLMRNAENVGFGRANNQAMRAAAGRRFLLLNSDTVLLDDSVGKLLEKVKHEPDVGVAHCRLTLPDGRLQHTAYRFPSLRLALVEDLGLYKLLPKRRSGSMLLSGYWDYAKERDVDWVAGAFMLLPRAVYEQTGGFDERLFMYGEDMEWCYRIRDQGWRIRYYPEAAIKHYDHTSSELRWGDERIALCIRRQRDIYMDRHGPTRTGALMALRVVGAALRTGYYSVRRITSPRARAYDDMLRSSTQSLRALLALTLPRR